MSKKKKKNDATVIINSVGSLSQLEAHITSEEGVEIIKQLLDRKNQHLPRIEVTNNTNVHLEICETSRTPELVNLTVRETKESCDGMAKDLQDAHDRADRLAKAWSGGLKQRDEMQDILDNQCRVIKEYQDKLAAANDELYEQGEQLLEFRHMGFWDRLWRVVRPSGEGLPGWATWAFGLSCLFVVAAVVIETIAHAIFGGVL